MAIMTRCCCCGIRQGSRAAAIYSLVIALLGILSCAVSVVRLPEYKDSLYVLKYDYPELHMFEDLNIDATVNAMKGEYALGFIVHALVAATSILLLQGIKMDRKDWLLPFIAAKAFAFILYLYALVLGSYVVSKMGMAAGLAAVLMLVAIILSVIIDIVCILCVLSQYQEYRDGRGRLSDEGVSLTQAGPGKLPSAGTGGVEYQHMSEEQDAPPPYNAPPYNAP